MVYRVNVARNVGRFYDRQAEGLRSASCILVGMKMLLTFLICAVSVLAQDWTPKHIVITDYVPLARAARIAGDVVIQCFLDSDGSVIRALVVSGHPLLHEQVRQNALLWKFEKTGSTVTSEPTVILRYQYRLEGKPQERADTVFVVDLPNTIQIIAHISSAVSF